MNTILKKIVLAAALVAGAAATSKSQSLPLTGGNMTGIATGPAFIQTGSVIDMAASGTLTTAGTNVGGGAIGRNHDAYTLLTINQSLTVDIGTDQVATNVLSFGTYWSTDSRYIPAGFNIDYSNNNTTWTNYRTVSGNTEMRPTYLPAIYARYWRLTITAMQSGYTTCNISGFQLIGVGVGATGPLLWNSTFSKTTIFTKSPVGIGTTDTQGYDLAVNGKVRAKEVNVETGWSDYVFYKSYRLRPLKEVKRYIKAYQHLPEVPSAAEVEKNGINVGEANSLLLKKVEELTLYMIEKDSQIEQQKKVNASLQRQLDLLSKQINRLSNKPAPKH